jgi:glycosyltransferase involved in cell wall biosynthesis
VLVDIALGLTEHEHRVVHFSDTNGVPTHPEFLTALVRARIPVMDTHWSAFNERPARQDVLEGFRPEVVLFHWWGKDPWRRWIDIAADAARGNRPTFVLVLHHADIRAPAGYDHYVLVSENQRTQVAHVPAERVHLIPNGVDLRRFRRAIPRRTRKEMVVGRVSGLREGKIPTDWVETAAAYGLRDTSYVVAGEGALRAPLEQRAAKLGLERDFSFPGYVSRAEVPHVLGGFDVFCYATSTAVECHPLALLESLAAGVPIVAEARGGVPAIVQHGVNGLLASSTDEIGRHLHALRRDGALRARLAQGARDTASRFGVGHQLDAYRRLLRTIEAERDGARLGAWCE